jgi:type III restriction enzyme
VQDGDNLEQTTGRAIYADCRIGEIREKDNEFMELRFPAASNT